ncbi:hypothetical protein DCCM_2682 [Desulfocucumis palustris]|uniref:Uncharacterized protein n=1 Tax=Desulfocucumis palustris TaxID=1898651 RepID=A0A2L2XB97_9FIRM|nr:hypothetical protein DCCM_2682 [Desulfocucumis palustris]
MATSTFGSSIGSLAPLYCLLVIIILLLLIIIAILLTR